MMPEDDRFVDRAAAKETLCAVCTIGAIIAVGTALCTVIYYKEPGWNKFKALFKSDGRKFQTPN